MLFNAKQRRGQGILDYILLLTIVVAALLIMGYYIRNSLSGKYREAADVFGQGETYIPNTR
jgi:uncharacterized protein (UPF0333 family)